MLNKNSLRTRVHYFNNSIENCFGGLKIYGYGCQSIQPYQSYPPRKHPKKFFFDSNSDRCLDTYTFLYLTEGAGKLFVDNVAFKVNQGDVILIQPGRMHSYFPYRTTGWTEYFVYFNGDVIDNIIRHSFIDLKKPVMTIGLNNEFVTLFNTMLCFLRIEEHTFYNRVAGIFMHVLCLLIYEKDNVKFRGSEYDEIIENAKIILQEYVFGSIKPAEVAKQLNVSYSSFRKKFKTITSFTPADYLMKLKIQKAKQYLVETNMPIKDIAYQLSFSSLEAFAVVFKKQTKYSPTQYRKFSR